MPPAPTRKARLGWLGPAIVAVGIAIGGFGVWFVVHSKPKASDTILDTVKIDETSKFVVRDEVNGDGTRSFVELVIGNDIKWQALIPRYAGKTGQSGIAWSKTAVLVRVIRNERAEIFALSMHDASKMGGFRLAPNHEAIAPDTGPITVSDSVRAYEIVNGPDWHQLVGIDLNSGRALWRVELGSSPISDAGVTGGELWLMQAGHKRKFFVFNGNEKPGV